VACLGAATGWTPTRAAPGLGAGLLFQFCLLSDNFTSNYENLTPKERKADALGIYNRFLSPQAPEPLGVRVVLVAGAGTAGRWRWFFLALWGAPSRCVPPSGLVAGG
jgi:hypothetical protein